MSCDGNNATPPSPAIAPGMAFDDPRDAVAAYLARTGGRRIDPRIPAAVPGFDAPFFQAGLAGYSDAAMRLIARRHGCPFCVTEALLDRTILAGGRGFAKADLGELEDNVPGGAEDRPLAGQIMGSDPAEMAAAAIKMAEQATRSDRAYRRLAYAGQLAPGVEGGTGFTPVGVGSASGGAGVPPAALGPVRPIPLRLPGGQQLPPFDPNSDLDDPASSDPRHLDTSPPRHLSSFATIDINLACPVKKVDRRARGGHWLAEPAGAIDILRAVRDAVPSTVACTLKLRRAYDDSPDMARNIHLILDAAFSMGYAWATVHARTVEQKYIGPSRWDILKGIVAAHPGALIFGSGDVWNVADLFRMLAYTGVSAVAVARGCIGNPWIFRQARALLTQNSGLSSEEALAGPTLAEQRQVLEDHFRLALAVNSTVASTVTQQRRAEVYTGKAMRKFGIRFAAHHPRADDVRRRFIAVTSLDDWRAVLDEWYPLSEPRDPTPSPTFHSPRTSPTPASRPA